MAHPWDRPPFPKRGNISQSVMFAAMGRALNAWEEVEISMAHLYAAFLTGDRFDPTANHAYGVEANFNQRSAGLQRIADNHFIGRPSQSIEGEFYRLIQLVTHYSARRNDIAHGHTLQAHWVLKPDSRATLLTAPNEGWCIVPPHFRANKFTNQNRPVYALTSWELNEFSDVFWDMARGISNLSIWVIQHVPSSPYIRPRPSALPYKVRDPRIRRG
jgi:hypothetical protein